jgi:hypothetical protein
MTSDLKRRHIQGEFAVTHKEEKCHVKAKEDSHI